MTNHYKFLLGIILLFILLWVTLNVLEKDSDAIYIAFVGPLSGKGAATGMSMVQAIQLQLDQINEQSGKKQKAIILDIFDDRNNSDRARTMAKKIVAQNRAVAVIGHNCNSCSINAGQIYKEYGIPAITPVSTNIKVTKGNEWYFRTIFDDDLQGRFLANYARNFLKQDTVSIIHTDTPYSSHLTKIFEETFKKLGDKSNDKTGVIKYKWPLQSEKELDQRINQITNDLKTKTDAAGLIFLATNAPEGFKLVSSLKNANIKNPT